MLSLLLAGLSSAGIFSATPASAASDVMVKVTAEGASKYVDDVGILFSEDSYALGGVEVDYKGFYVGAQKMVPLFGGDGLEYKNDFRNEAIYSAGYRYDEKGGFVAELGMRYHDLVQSLAIAEYSAKVGYHVTPGVTPFAKITYHANNDEAKENAVLLFGGADFYAKLSEKASINGTAMLFHNGGELGSEAAYGYSLKIEPTYAVTEHVALSASLRYVNVFGKDVIGYEENGQVVAGIGTKITF